MSQYAANFRFFWSSLKIWHNKMSKRGSWNYRKSVLIMIFCAVLYDIKCALSFYLLTSHETVHILWFAGKLSTNSDVIPIVMKMNKLWFFCFKDVVVPRERSSASRWVFQWEQSSTAQTTQVKNIFPRPKHNLKHAFDWAPMMISITRALNVFWIIMISSLAVSEAVQIECFNSIYYTWK